MEVKSILQKNPDCCFLCGQPARWDDPLDLHHIFGGALRKKSEVYGLTVRLHHNSCHIFGADAVHNNAVNNAMLKDIAQRKAMRLFQWTMEDWRQRFYKNYLLEDDEPCTTK